MAFKRENYTLRGICILVYVLFNLSLSAQDQACPIWADLEPIADQSTSSPTIYSQSVSIPFYDWEQLDSSRYSDDQYSKVTIPGYKRSQIVSFSRLGHDIPDGAAITGIKLSIEGHQTGAGNITDYNVQLTGSNVNKANQYLGMAFPDSIDQVWIYGGEDDTWGRNWYASEINSSNFGLEYQVRNSVSGDVTFLIDQITVEIFYTPMYTFCNDEHACVAFGVEEVPGYSYNWHIPMEFTRLSSLNEQHTVNIGATELAAYGQYSLCIDVYDENNEFAENCCRNFKYENCKPAFIGDQVFLDNDHDNTFSDGDVGLEGVVVMIFDEFNNFIESTITDENGLYQFKISSGSYYLQIELPEGMLPIDANVGSDDVDSDLTNSNGPLTTNTFFVEPETIIDNIDIGLDRELVIGDRVWEDKNYNGIQDPQEVGVSGIEILLVDNNGATVKSTTSDVGGFYQIDGVRVGEYELVFISSGGYIPTQQGMGSEDKDSDIDDNGSTGIVDFDLLDIPFVDLDAGFYRYASVGNYVFFDGNENGIQDSLDLGLNNISVTLSTVSGIELQTVISDDAGIYLFDSLTPGQYVISSEGTELIKPTFALQGSDSTLDNDLQNNDGDYSTSVFMLMSNESNVDIDLGWKDNLAYIGGQVFEDIKYDGQYNVSDSLLADVIVNLIHIDGDVIQTQSTDINGEYLFLGIFPGSYYVRFGAADDYLYTQINIGDDTTDSDVTSSIENGSTDAILVTPGMELLNIDAGVYRNTSIGDYVFIDLNEDGIQNVGDTGLSGMELTLLDDQGLQVAVDTSDANGAYLFDNLLPGVYSITLTSSDLYLETITGAGSPSTDSDLLENNGQYFSDVIATCSGQQIDNIDFGFINNYATLSGQVYEDNKADGIFNEGDTTINNVVVSLYNTMDEVVYSTTTDVLGQFIFEDVLAGEYYIGYGLSSAYIYSTNNVSGANGIGSTDEFVLAPGEIVSNQITGAYVLGSIGDYVFLDMDENGIQGPLDTGLGGIELTLLRNNGTQISTSISADDGSYNFDGIVPGTYNISLVKSDLYLSTLRDIGEDELDSDLINNTGNYMSPSITICSGQSNNTIDFGFVHNYASISGTIYEDSKADKIFNAPDTLLVAIPVTLYNSDGQITQSIITDNNGNFIFEDILAGDYYIVYGLGSQYIYSTDNVTGDFTAGSTSTISLLPGEENTSQSTGAYVTATIGNYVFLDLNENGLQDAEDGGIAGISISLFDMSGEVMDMSTTGVDGAYTFGNLLPGNYTISLLASDLYLPTQFNAGESDSDSDLLTIMGDYESSPITVCSGQNEETIDFGFINNYASIRGQLYEDSKADSLFNDIDTSLANVVVTLHNMDNTVSQSTTTDASGDFVFEDVLEGEYYIKYGLDETYNYTSVDVTGAFGTGSTDSFSLPAGGSRVENALGAYRAGSIGDYVFLDLNDNGIQDDTDQGLEGIFLQLYNTDGILVSSTTSTSTGAYNFDELTPGGYTIFVTSPDLYLATLPFVGDANMDSDLLFGSGLLGTTLITICSGEGNQSIDLGLANNYAKIGGEVFTDVMADGQLMPMDELLSGIPVVLFDADNMEVASTLSDENGSYLFNNIVAGDYYVVFDLGDKLVTLSNVGEEATDSDVTGVNGIGSTDLVTLAPGQCNLTVSAGAYELASIGDYVWLDDNRNGLQDIAEQGIGDVVINLYNQSSLLIAKDTTDVNGIYGFAGLIPGMYYIQVEYPEDLTATINTLTDPLLNSDLTDDFQAGTSSLIALGSGETNLNIDAGLAIAGAEIQGEVWIDLDGNETQSATDTLLSSIPVKLFDANSGAEVFSTQTNVNGAYSFKPIENGDYYVQFEIADTLVYVTSGLGGAAFDSDVDMTNGIGTTDTISVVEGDVIEDVDAGVENGKSQISGLVFIDKNGDGINDVSEVNLNSYTVNVHIVNGTIIKSVMSDMDGTYLIDNVATGDYYLTFTEIGEYVFTSEDAAGDDTIDSDVTGSQGAASTNVFALGIQDAQVYDAGVYQLGSLGNFVWFDANENGVQDTDELGVAMANLTISNIDGENLDATNTLDDGAYLFDGLAPGRYVISIDAPSGYIATNYQVGTDKEIDSDLLMDGTLLGSDTITIMSGQDDLSIDFGLIENPGTIEGFVWNDINVDGIFNDGTSTFDAVTVELYSANTNMLIGSTLTDPDGGYIFNDVSPKDYFIKFVLNANTTFTAADQGADDNIDSDVTSGGNGEGTTETFTLNSGQSLVNIYAGLIFPAKIGNLVFLDQNFNGLQDSDESGIAMMKVILFDENGVKLDSVLTDAEGMYTFADLNPANYYLEFVFADDIRPTMALPIMPALNSDITEGNGTGTTDMIFLGSGVCNEDVDGGFTPSGAVIRGEVWLDTNGDDVKDNPNNLVEGIEVTLLGMGDIIIDGPVLTNELGMYGFSAVPTGSYYVKFDIPDTLAFVNSNVGILTNPDLDSDVTETLAIGSTDPFIVLDGELYDYIDAGVRDIRSTINGQLFVDADGDGVKDVVNIGLGGVEVTLLVFGSEVSSTTTDVDGSYVFEGLQANFYNIEFSNLPSTIVFTEANVGDDDSIDSDVTSFNNGIGSASVLIALDEVVSIDGGVYELASVGNYVWIDENNDGIQDPTELPQAGVLVEAIDADLMVVGSSTTDDTGRYMIEGLPPGSYTLIFNNLDNYIPTIANVGDDTLDSDINAVDDEQSSTASFDLFSGEQNIDLDAGFIFSQVAEGAISGLVWRDSDGNGIRQANNTVTPNIGVVLFNDLNMPPDSTVTNADGEYFFTELVEGNYYVVFQNEIGTFPTTPDVGSDLTDSDITMANGSNSTDIINLGESEVVENVDGGFIAVGAIGNQVFVDINGNGSKSEDEPGLNGVTVKLFDETTGELLQTTVTDTEIATMERGFYQFNDVKFGSYYLVFELPEPYLFTNGNGVADDTIDSDVTNGVNGAGSTDAFSLVSGEVKDDVDAGAFLPAKLGDFVWDDLNGDGIQNEDEPGIPNITVILKRSFGFEVANTTTDANGNYCFLGLRQGLYFIEFVVPEGYVVSPMGQGSSGSLDSDVDATGVTPLVNIAHGSSFNQVDAGLISQTMNNLMSHVWFDDNLNGIYEENETLMKDVEVSLINDEGTVVDQMMTNLVGRYAFVNMPEGDYQISVTLEDGYTTTMMNAGTDDWVDSDVDASGMSAVFTVDDGVSVPNVDIGIIDDTGIVPEMDDETETLFGEQNAEHELIQDESPVTFVSGPNPFYNRVQVKMNRLVSGVAYNIYGLDGTLVKSGVILEKNQWIELEQQNDGMYIMVVTHNNKLVDRQYLMKVN